MSKLISRLLRELPPRRFTQKTLAFRERLLDNINTSFTEIMKKAAKRARFEGILKDEYIVTGADDLQEYCVDALEIPDKITQSSDYFKRLAAIVNAWPIPHANQNSLAAYQFINTKSSLCYVINLLLEASQSLEAMTPQEINALWKRHQATLSIKTDDIETRKQYLVKIKFNELNAAKAKKPSREEALQTKLPARLSKLRLVCEDYGQELNQSNLEKYTPILTILRSETLAPQEKMLALEGLPEESLRLLESLTTQKSIEVDTLSETYRQYLVHLKTLLPNATLSHDIETLNTLKTMLSGEQMSWFKLKEVSSHADYVRLTNAAKTWSESQVEKESSAVKTSDKELEYFEEVRRGIHSMRPTFDINQLQATLASRTLSTQEKLDEIYVVATSPYTDTKLRTVLGQSLQKFNRLSKHFSDDIESVNSNRLGTLFASFRTESLPDQAASLLTFKSAFSLSTEQLEAHLEQNKIAKLNYYLIQLAGKVVEFQQKAPHNKQYAKVYAATYTLYRKLTAIVDTLADGTKTSKEANDAWQKELAHASSTLGKFRGLFAILKNLIGCIFTGYQTESQQFLNKMNEIDFQQPLDREILLASRIEQPTILSIDDAQNNADERIDLDKLVRELYDLALNYARPPSIQLTAQLQRLTQAGEQFQQDKTPDKVVEIQVAAIEAVKLAKLERIKQKISFFGQPERSKLEKLESKILHYELSPKKK